ncbi:hypothetical protein L873DRAFT_512223 [Choiromyces venosus 120613-1]|uniref:Uncharacterized protein n=1 Tax=Choiromyces venosus 120613-1 TaxID=1336337 RepID=A0A3N4IVU6_9PEZI|nr:hypothetical protein L873DRAFT_512223 [Choiromyces venosus 120613-1]
MSQNPLSVYSFLIIIVTSLPVGKLYLHLSAPDSTISCSCEFNTIHIILSAALIFAVSNLSFAV